MSEKLTITCVVVILTVLLRMINLVRMFVAVGYGDFVSTRDGTGTRCSMMTSACRAGDTLISTTDSSSDNREPAGSFSIHSSTDAYSSLQSNSY